MRTMPPLPPLPPKSPQSMRPQSHQLEAPQEQTLRQYLEANNLLSQASRAIGQQMKTRRGTSRGDALYLAESGKK